jgi:hypothetical protein
MIDLSKEYGVTLYEEHIVNAPDYKFQLTHSPTNFKLYVLLETWRNLEVYYD